MNYEQFKYYYEEMAWDQVQVIGRDVTYQKKPYHLLAVTKKEENMHFYLLEMATKNQMEGWEEEDEEYLQEYTGKDWRTKSNREQLIESLQSETSPFMNVEKIIVGGVELAVESISSGECIPGDETLILFSQMAAAGWSLSETSPFYQLEWQQMAITKISFEGENREMPKFEGKIRVCFGSSIQEFLTEQPFLAKVGEEQQFSFLSEQGKEITCYINSVQIYDIWKREQERFADEEYHQKMLEHMTEEEFTQMKDMFWQTLEETCPKGKCFMTVEYECSQDVTLMLYAKEYLDTIPEPMSSASALFFGSKSSKESGSHGYPLHTSVIQYPVAPEVQELELELFSFGRMSKKKTVNICELLP